MNPVDEKIIIKKLKAGDNEAYKYMIIIMLLSANLVIIC